MTENETRNMFAAHALQGLLACFSDPASVRACNTPEQARQERVRIAFENADLAMKCAIVDKPEPPYLGVWKPS
jgi:hypothetical protein